MKLYFVNHDSEVFDATEATSSVKWSGKTKVRADLLQLQC